MCASLSPGAGLTAMSVLMGRSSAWQLVDRHARPSMLGVAAAEAAAGGQKAAAGIGAGLLVDEESRQG